MNNILLLIGEATRDFINKFDDQPNAIFLGKAERSIFNAQMNALWQITFPCDGEAEYLGMKLVAVDLPSFLAVGILGKVQKAVTL